MPALYPRNSSFRNLLIETIKLMNQFGYKKVQSYLFVFNGSKGLETIQMTNNRG